MSQRPAGTILDNLQLLCPTESEREIRQRVEGRRAEGPLDRRHPQWGQTDHRQGRASRLLVVALAMELRVVLGRCPHRLR